MDQEILDLINQLPVDLQPIFRQILNGTLPIGPALLIELLRRALTRPDIDRGILLRLLTWLAKAGQLTRGVLEAAIADIQAAMTGGGAAAGGAAEGAAGAAGGGAGAAGGGAAVGGGAAAGGGGGAVGGGAAAGGGEAAAAVGAGCAATILAMLVAVLAILVAVYSVYSEVTKKIELPADGMPCGLGTAEGREMATIDRSITVRAIGTRTSLQKAIDAAQTSCEADAHKCKGNCPNGKRCWPSASIQSWTQWYRVFWTTTEVVFRCPCACIDKP